MIHRLAVYAGPESLVARTRRLVVIGDTQETLWPERTVGFEQNAGIRPTVLAEVAARRPDGVVHLGDLVGWGSATRHWRRLDRDLGPLREMRTPVMPVVGNHDRMPLPALGLRHMRERFAVLAERTWYSFRFGGVSFVMLDSNLGRLDPRGREQQRWLAETLAAEDLDPSVRAIVGCWHHPAMTNSRRVGLSEVAREVFLPALAARRKAIATFSGHCHGFEHFRERGLDCFVSGGGGGPRHPIETRPERRRGEDLFAGGRVRFLHFLELEAGPEAMVLHVVRLSRHEPRSGFEIAARVELPYRFDG